MQRLRLSAFTLSACCVLCGSSALSAEQKVSQDAAVMKASAPAAAVKMRPRVPPFPADIKTFGNRLRSKASPAVRSWAGQIAPSLAKASGDPEGPARAAATARWPNLRVAGAYDALTFLAIYDAAEILQADAEKLDSLGDLSQEQSMRLQMLMDRRSKFMTTLSNLMKKISDTAEGIVSNLK
jgi:hypothetical protein